MIVEPDDRKPDVGEAPAEVPAAVPAAEPSGPAGEGGEADRLAGDASEMLAEGEDLSPGDERDELAVEPEEVVDGLPVPSSQTRVLEPLEGAPVPARQAAALAATGFVAGAATVALVQRRRVKVAAKRGGRGKKRNAIGEIVSSNSFLVDVHLLRRD